MPTKSENFAKYPNKIFIETGSYVGDGIQQALDAGFENVISIELSDKYFNISSNRFINNPRVKVVKGNSYIVLPDILKDIEVPVTFWLDGHYSCGDTALGDYWAPLMQELEAIKRHKINTHTIMIDDMRCWEEPNPVHVFYKNDIINKLIEINSEYKLTYEYGLQKDDVLVANI